MGVKKIKFKKKENKKKRLPKINTQRDNKEDRCLKAKKKKKEKTKKIVIGKEE